MVPHIDPPLAHGHGRTPTVFLIGAARSGTTLLYKALCLHPEVAYISNWVRRYPGLPALARLDAIPRHLPRARQRVWFRDDNAYVYGDSRPLLQRIFPMPVEGETVFRRCGVPLHPGDPALPGDEQRARLADAFAAIRAHDGGAVLVNKRIANNWRIDLLVGAFPDARFVVMVRDGRAVARSLSKVDWWPTDRLFWESGTPAELERSGRDPWELCATNWCRETDAIEEGLSLVPPDRVLRTSYEAFVADPVPALTSIIGFVGLDAVAPWRRSLAQLRFPDRNAAWRNDLPADAAATVERVQADHLRRYGYR